MIRLKDIIKEIEGRNLSVEKRAYSWQNPDGNFFPVKYTHDEDAVKYTGDEDIDSMVALWKDGWQRIRFSLIEKRVLFCHNEYMIPNYKQLIKLKDLAIEGDFEELVYEGEDTKGKILWSKHDVLEEEDKSRENLKSWLDPNGKFHNVLPTETHYTTAIILVKNIGKNIGKNEDSTIYLFEHGWQRVVTRGTYIYVHNPFKPPNDRQKTKVIRLAIDFELNAVSWDGSSNKGYIIWSKEDVLEDYKLP